VFLPLFFSYPKKKNSSLHLLIRFSLFSLILLAFVSFGFFLFCPFFSYSLLAPHFFFLLFQPFGPFSFLFTADSRPNPFRRFPSCRRLNASKKKKKKPRETGPVSAGPAGDDPPSPFYPGSESGRSRRKHLKNNRHNDFYILHFERHSNFSFFLNKNLDLFVQPNKLEIKDKTNGWTEIWLLLFLLCWAICVLVREKKKKRDRRRAWDYGEPLQTLFFSFEIFPILIF
jgi:hypothetical protein